MPEPTDDDYALRGTAASKTGPAPELPYRPPTPRDDKPRIALVGCGGITALHLAAYKAYGWDVVAMMDLRREAAESRRDEFYPDATVYADLDDVLERDDIDVVDLAMHPEPRAGAVVSALRRAI